MLLSWKLLTSLFPIFNDVNYEEFEEIIHKMGCEIESIKRFNKIDNLIVGQIKSVTKHPKSNKLNLCKVDIGNEIKNIVCGAQNVVENAKIILANIGSTINGITIAEREILGEKSEGMICAYNELNNDCEFVSDYDKETIIILSNDAIIGDKNPLKYINLDDVIYDISIPSNRNELNGISIMAIEILSMLNLDFEYDYDIDFDDYKTNDIIITKDKNTKFFATAKFSNVNIEQSNWKIKSYLMNLNVKPVNFIVDMTNFILLISGNPINAYDGSQIDNKIKISTTTKQVNVIGLDNNQYKIPQKSIVVSSKNKPIAIAGVIGLENSCIKNETNSVVFEIGNFNNLNIMNTSQNSNIKTKSAQLFSKNIPLWSTLNALKLLLDFMVDKKFNFDGISYTKIKLNQNKIKFNFKKIQNLLGFKISKNQIVDYLNNIGFIVSDDYIKTPIYREDINNIQDIVEELIKVIGINNIIPKPIENSKLDINLKNNEFINFKKINDFFIGKGFSLVKTYNLTSENINSDFNLFDAKKAISLLNPISNDRKVLRTSLIHQLLEVYSYNFSYKNLFIPIFEVQKLNYDNCEKYHLCFISTKNIFKNVVNKSHLKVDIFYLKSIINDFNKMIDKKVNFQEITDTKFNFLIKNNSLKIVDNTNKTIGYCGQINPEIIKKMKMNDTEIYFCEIIIDDFIKHSNDDFSLVKNEINYEHSISRELSIILDNQSISTLIDAINKSKDILSYSINDVYKISESSFSYNIEFELNMNELEKTNENISVVFNRIIEYFKKESFKIKGV